MGERAPISDQAFAARLLTELAGRPVQVSPAPRQGWVNRVYFGSDLVVRFNRRPGYDRRFRRETWCAAAARAVGVPGPEVLAVGHRDGVAFMVTRRVQGTMAEELRHRDREIWTVLGEHAARIATVRVTGYGEGFGYVGHGFGRVAPEITSWSGSVEAQRDRLEAASWLVDREAIDAGGYARVLRAVERLAAWRFSPQLCHADLGWDNALVDADGTVAVLDWGNATASRAPLPDLAGLVVWASEEALAGFLDGFGMSRSELDDLQDDLTAMVLASEAAVLVEWLPTAEANWNDPARSAQRNLGRLLATRG